MVFNLTNEEKEVFKKRATTFQCLQQKLRYPRLIAGVSYDGAMGKNFTYLVELMPIFLPMAQKQGVLSGKNFSLDPSMGAEIGYSKPYFLRLGIGNLQRVLNEVNANKRDFDFQPNVGLGLLLGRLKLDYALANVGNVSGAQASHIFSVSLDLSEKVVLHNNATSKTYFGRWSK